MRLGPRWRKPVLALAVLLAALSCAELGLRAWLAARGRPYTQAHAREELARWIDFAQNFGADPAQRPRDERAGAYRGPDLLHPFFAFDRPGGAELLARELARPADPSRELCILIVGGSVAATFAELGAPRLAELLRADPRLAGREPRFLDFARAAAKQPQQLTTVAYLASMGLAFDLVLAIDGFNEVAIGSYNHQRGTNPAYPWHDKWLALALGAGGDPLAHELEQRLRASRRELLQRSRAARESAFLGSALLGSLTLARLRALHAGMARDQEAWLARSQEREIPAHLLGPPFEGGGRDALEFLVRHWRESSFSIHALCAARGVRYLHVLQPALHDQGSKPLRPEELEGAAAHPSWIEGVRAGYPLLREAGEELRARGLCFLDASGVFREVEERIYRDACHFGERGNELLAEAIAPALLELLLEK